MTLAELIIELAIKFPQFEEGLERAGLAVEQRMLEMKRAADQLQGIDQALEPLTGALLRVGAVGGVVTGALFMMAKGASESAERLERLRAVAEASNEVLDFERLVESANRIAALGKASNAAAVEMQRVMVSAGLTQEQIDQLTPRVLDFAKVTGVDVVSAARLLTRAMILGNAAIGRYLVGVDRSIEPTKEFARWLEDLDRVTGKAAQGSMGLGEALQSLYNALGSLRTTLGQNLPELTKFTIALADAVRAVDAFAKENPELVRAFVRFAGVLGVVAVGLGALGAAIKTAKWLFGGLLLGAKAVAVLLAGPLLLKAIATIGLLAAGVFLVKTAFDGLKGMIRSAAEKLGLIPKRTKEATDAAQDLTDAQKRLNKALEEQKETLEEIAERHAKRSREIALAAEQEKAAIHASARTALSVANLTGEQLAAIQGRTNAAIIESDRKRLRQQIAFAEEELARARRLGPAKGEQEAAYTKRVEELAINLANLRGQLDESYVQEHRRLHEARLDQERALQAESVRLAETTGQAKLDVIRAQADTQLTIDRQTADLIQQRAEAELTAFRRREEIRLGLLRQAIDAEMTARRNALSILETIHDLQAERERRALERRNRALAELVKQGYFTEAEAREIAEAEAEEFERRRIQRAIEVEEQRLAITQTGIDREMELVRQESVSRIALLEAETKAKKANIELSARLRQSELDMSLRIARLETEGRIRELQIRRNHEIAMAKQSLDIKRAAGEIDEQTYQMGLRQLEMIRAGSDAQIGSLRQVIDLRRQAIEEQKKAISLSAQEAIAAADTELRDRRIAIQQETVLELNRLEGERAKAALESAAKIEGLQMQVAGKYTLSMDEIVNVARRGMAILSGQWEGLKTTAVNAIDTMEKRLRDWWDEVKGAVGTAKDLGKTLDELGRIKPPEPPAPIPEGGVWVPPPPERRFKLTPPPAPGPPPGAITPAPPAVPAMTQTINVEGTQVRLEADKQRLFQDLLKMLMGPDGAREFENFMRRQAGAHAR